MFSFFLTLFPYCPSVNHQLSVVETFVFPSNPRGYAVRAFDSGRVYQGKLVLG